MLLGIQGKVLPQHPFGKTGVVFDLRAFFAGKVIAVVTVLVQTNFTGPIHSFMVVIAGTVQFLNCPAQVRVALQLGQQYLKGSQGIGFCGMGVGEFLLAVKLQGGSQGALFVAFEDHPHIHDAGIRCGKCDSAAQKLFSQYRYIKPPAVTQAAVEDRPIKEVLEEEQDNLAKGKAEALRFAEEKEQEAGKLNTVRSLADINDAWDLINFAATAAGEAGVQIPLAIATGGLSSAMQSIGQVYAQGVQKLAENEETTVEDIIAQGKDDQLTALLYGTAAGMLDRIGAKTVGKAISPNSFVSSLRNRAKDLISKAPSTGRAAATEGLTEMLQTGIEQIGGQQVGGASLVESIQGLNGQQLIDAGALGAIGGGLGAAAGKAGKSIADKVQERSINADQANRQMAEQAQAEAAQETKPSEDAQSTQEEKQPITPQASKEPQRSQQRQPERVESKEEGMLKIEPTPQQNNEDIRDNPQQEKEQGMAEISADPKQNEETTATAPEEEAPVKVQNVPVKELTTDEKRFQNREEKFSEKSVQSIINAVENGTFDVGEFDPVRVWTDPQDNKTYVLAGHSRREAFRRLNAKGTEQLSDKAKKNLENQGIKDFSTIPTIDLSNKNEAEAIAYATERSNTLSTSETELEGAQLYRRKREAGEADNKIKDDLKGRANLQRLKLLSYLNPKGSTYDAIKATQAAETSDNKNRLIQIGEFIGEARQKFPELTDAHENELFKYLSTGPGQKITTRRDFTERLERVTGDAFFDPKQPLNLENRVTRGTLETEADQKLQDTKKRIKELEKERDKGAPGPSRLNEISREIERLNKDLFTLTENVRKARMADRLQMDMFAPSAQSVRTEARESAETIMQNAFNPLRPIMDAVAKAFSLVNKVQERTFGRMVNRMEDAIANMAVRGITSRNKFVRSSTTALSNLMGGLLYTSETAAKKMGFQGGLNYADKQAEIFYQDALKIVDEDPQALIRVHSLLDQEAYQNKADLQQDNLPKNVGDLNDSERILFELLRQANEDIHQYHYDNGLIDEDTFKKYEGKYIARIYEEGDLDNLPDDVKEFIEQQSSYGRTKINTDIFKARKEISEVKSKLIQDPVYLTAKRLAQMQKHKAILDYARQVADTFQISDQPRPGFTQLKSSRNRYGVLTNKYVPNFIAQDFKGFFFADRLTNTLYDAFKV